MSPREIRIDEKFRVVNSALEMVSRLEFIQRSCFPSLAEEEVITAAHYAAHIRLFPEGQLAVVEEGGEAVACSTDFRSRVDFEHFDHRYIEAVGQNWLTRHDPRGEWLYGADIGVLPGYRGRGIASLLYRARRDLIRRLNLRGHVGGALLRGYPRYQGRMTAEEYVARVAAGELLDPTLTVQLKNGFRVHGVLHNYVDDPSCGGKAAFIVWHNPAYVED